MKQDASADYTECAEQMMKIETKTESSLQVVKSLDSSNAIFVYELGSHISAYDRALDSRG